MRRRNEEGLQLERNRMVLVMYPLWVHGESWWAWEKMSTWKCSECCKNSDFPSPCILTVEGKEIRQPTSCVYQKEFPTKMAVWVKSWPRNTLLERMHSLQKSMIAFVMPAQASKMKPYWNSLHPPECDGKMLWMSNGRMSISLKGWLNFQKKRRGVESEQSTLGRSCESFC